MSQRPGVQLTVQEPVDGGEHPNRYFPAISAHVRVYWPAHADIAEVYATLDRAHSEATKAIAEKWEAEHASSSTDS